MLEKLELYVAKNEFRIFETMLFRENSEKLEPQIQKNWSRPKYPLSDRPESLISVMTLSAPLAGASFIAK